MDNWLKKAQMKKASDFIIPDFVFYIYINRLGFI